MANKKWFDNAVMVNRDPNWIYAVKGSTPEECNEGFAAYISQYEGAVTDVMLGMLEQTAAVPNSSFMWRGEKFLQKVENGHEVNYPEFENLYRAYTELGFDGVQIFIDEMNKKGIRPWLTFRMNDAHFSDDETSFLHSDMFYEEKAAGHTVTKRYGYYGNLFSWKYPRYKNAILNYIGEMAERYDVFGIELDFMRELICFDYIGDPDGIQEIMLDYMRAVKARITEAEKIHGHDIKISIRICRDPDEAYDFGFDIKTMVDEGLVDVVVPTAHYSCTDSGMPMRRWRKLLGDKAALMGGIETANIRYTENTREHSKAYAASFYAQGADGIYYNNHEYYTERNRQAWSVNRDTCYIGRREFVVTYQDYAAYSALAYKPLPHTFNYSTFIPVEIGKVKKNDKVTLLIDFEGEKNPIAEILGVIDAEGKVVEPLICKKPFKGEENLTEHTPIEYDLSGFATEGKVAISFKGKGTIHYIKLTIDAE